MDEETQVVKAQPTKTELMEMVRTGKYDPAIIQSVTEQWMGRKMKYVFVLADGTKVKI
jgi:hypothetical protein